MRRAETGKRARDAVQPVDLRQDPAGRFVQGRFELRGARLAADALQMLNPEPDGRERILDFMRDLARHLAPGEDARGARQRGRVVERDDAAIRRRAEQRELHTNLPAVDLELELLDDIAILRDELRDCLPHRRPTGRGSLREHIARR